MKNSHPELSEKFLTSGGRRKNENLADRMQSLYRKQSMKQCEI